MSSQQRQRSSSLSASAFTAHRIRHTLRNTASSMPKRRRTSDLSPDDLVSSSEETRSSGEETDSSPSSPSTRAHHGTPEPADHHPRHDDRSSPLTRSPRRQPVRRLGPPRPRPSNSDRQMTMLDIDWEVRRLERFRRQQPESFGRRRAAARSESVPARASAGHSRRRRLAEDDSFIEEFREFRRLQNDLRLLGLRRLRPENREREYRAAMAARLTYDNARIMLRMQSIPIVTLTLHLIRTPTLSTTLRQSTSPHSHY